jgi:heme oxygenase
MLPLKEAIAEKHSLAEKMPFNQKMFRGELNNEEYANYLTQQYAIFNTLEKNPLPHPSLNRAELVKADIIELINEDSLVPLLLGTAQYCDYLNTLTAEEQQPHIYLNYLAIMFGGQMMKEKTPGSGRMYEFVDMREAAGSIRAIQKDEWADEANKALDYNIDILDELHRIFG